MESAQPDSPPPEDGIIQTSISIDEVRGFAEAIGLNRAAPGRCSTVLMFELYVRFRVPTIPGDPAKIVHEIRALEGGGHISRMKPADQFERLPLRGLWKQHYLVGGLPSMAENIRLGTGKRGGELMRIVKAYHNPALADQPPEVVAKRIADAVTGLYWTRSQNQQLTGEWIVFAKHQGQNFYLCLGAHGDDAEIYDRIKSGCVGEFPFLVSQLF